MFDHGFLQNGVGVHFAEARLGEGANCGPGHWRLVFAVSRFLKDAETRYLHLLHILGDNALDQIQNQRLRSMKEKTLRFSFKAIYVPGSVNLGPDAAARYSVKEANNYVLDAMAWCNEGTRRWRRRAWSEQ